MIFTPSYGVCYMFNFRGLQYEKYPAVTFYPGEEYGLQLAQDPQWGELLTQARHGRAGAVDVQREGDPPDAGKPVFLS